MIEQIIIEPYLPLPECEYNLKSRSMTGSELAVWIVLAVLYITFFTIALKWCAEGKDD
jgi:hypothetical protein